MPERETRGARERAMSVASTTNQRSHPLQLTQPAGMDLATVKAKVKSWERAFRAEHAREPTKEDVMRDPTDIGK